MEPTTNTNKTKMAVIIVILLIIAIGAFFFIKSKSVKAPVVEEVKTNEPAKVTVKTVITEGESKEITKYLDDATTFYNEASLKQIDMEF